MVVVGRKVRAVMPRYKCIVNMSSRYIGISSSPHPWQLPLSTLCSLSTFYLLYFFFSAVTTLLGYLKAGEKILDISPFLLTLTYLASLVPLVVRQLLLLDI